MREFSERRGLGDMGEETPEPVELHYKIIRRTTIINTILKRKINATINLKLMYL